LGGKSVFIVIFIIIIMGVGSLEKATADEGSHTVRVGNRAGAKTRWIGQIPSDRGLCLTPQFRNGGGWGSMDVIQSKVVEGMDIEVVASGIYRGNRSQLVQHRETVPSTCKPRGRKK
jgi:hypothetical protein